MNPKNFHQLSVRNELLFFVFYEIIFSFLSIIYISFNFNNIIGNIESIVEFLDVWWGFFIKSIVCYGLAYIPFLSFRYILKFLFRNIFTYFFTMLFFPLRCFI